MRGAWAPRGESIMTSVAGFLGEDHRRCDEDFARAAAAAEAGNMSECARLFECFRTRLLRHIHLEEELLFPSFEDATGNTAGPTQIMRHEHGVMRVLIEQLRRASSQHSAADYLAHAAQLTQLLQQHNMKEERILYPMCDQVLAHDLDGLLARMTATP
jgi:hemerythrin-like domain-containing protein